MNNNLTLSVTLTGDGRQLSGTLKDAQGDVRDFTVTTERESRKAEEALTAPGRSATTVSEHLRETQREARAFGTEAARGGSEANQALAQTGQQAQTTTGHLNSLRRMAGLAFGAFSVRQVVGMTDGWSDMQSVVGAAIGDMSEAGDMMRRITDIANASYAPLELTARTYASNVSALRDLGRTADEAADYTESLNHMLVLTATRGQQAESVQNALSRAMAVGTLQADGLQTVLANGGEVAQALANQLGVTVSQLRGLASEGKITGDVIASALIGSLDDVRDRAGEMPATIEDGFVRMGTSARRLVGELDQAMGTSEGVAGIIINAADMMTASIDPLLNNIDNIQFAATAVAVVLAGRYVGAIATSQAALAAKTAVVATTTGAINLLTGATTRQAAAATAMAGATRVATGALALVGGPAGAAVIAAGAIYYFREELGLVDVVAQNTTNALEENTAAIRSGTTAALDASYDNLINALEAVSLQAQDAMAQMVELETRQAFYENSHKGMADSVTGAIDQQAQSLAGLWEEQVRIQTAIRENRAERENATTADRAGAIALDDITVSAAKSTQTTKAATQAAREAAAAALALTKATEAQAAAIEALRNRMRPGRAEVVQLAQDQNTLNLAFAMGRIGVSEYLQLMGALQQAHMDTGETAKEAADQISVNVSTWATVSENAIRRVDDAGVDLWLGFIDGSRSALDTVKRGFQQTLAEIAHMLTTQRLTVAVAGSLGFAAGGVGGADSSSGFGINPGSIGNMWNAVQGGFNGIQWGGAGGAQAYGGGWANAATSGTGATGYLGGSLQNFSGMQGLAGLGAGFAGNYLGGQLFGQGSQSNTLGAVGGLAGTYLGGPIGALLGSGLGSALGGLFGGRKWNETGSGVNLGVSGGDVTGNQFSEQHSKGGLFRSSRRRTQTSALDGEFSGALQEVYDATEQSLAATIEVLGFQSSALAGFTTGLTRIDTKGLSAEDAEAKIQEWLSNTLNALAIHSVGDVSQYALGGETTIETVERLAVALGTLNPILEQLHGSTLAASMAGGSAASHLADLDGGIDAFSARADFYYQNVLTETERQERAMAAAAQAIGAFTARTGQVINSTDALRDLVDSIDLTTASGRELYSEAMNLAPALVEIERGLERVGQRFDQMLQEAESALATAEQQARRAWQTFDQQQFGMQLELLSLMGDSEGALALERERELATIDDSLRPMRERIWAMQDEVTVQQNATTAARNYQRELSRVRDQLNQQLANIGNWLDQQQANSGSPEMNLATAQEQLARQLVLAENGDRNALQNITQYAQQVLDANRDYNASSLAGQRIQQDVYDAIRALPESITAEEFLAGEIRDALQSVVISAMPTDERLAFELSRELTRLDTNQLTVSQVRAALSPIASDAEISRLIRQVDANGDGIITKQELANLRLTGLAGGIGSTLKPMFDSLDANLDGLIDWNEFYGAFQGLASDDELKRIFRQLDKDGSGTISRLEALNRTSQGTELNTDSLEKQARDQLSELNGLVSEMARSTDQFVGLNSTMVSLRDSINALGVAQADIVRIEKERAAAEKAARQRIETERAISGFESAAANAERQSGALAARLDPRDAGNITRLIDNRMSDGVFSNAEWQEMISHLNKVFGRDSLEYLYGREYAAMYRNQTRANEERAKLSRFANGGIFESGRVIDTSTRFNIGEMGEAGPEMILPVERMSNGKYGMQARLGFDLPSFPLLGNNDVLETLRDLKREVAELRRDNAQLQRESNKHLAAANNQRGAAATGQIGAIERGNKMLKKLEDDKRLEAAKR
ncbi:hypothetical protein LCGC14_0074520 [marine sediment metagenome]|uniref:EF-hand domain-containing protein n=1 Tax=marine sediment metagenome TaxID=412755 RepID=A0A0F9VL46_9ZZZZ|nr:tape measure protein [Halomonas sp.]HDZ48780.1 hypothetical protein [Halomonas sp.]HEB05513.1 hypothetical protein [Halomonas sp.]